MNATNRRGKRNPVNDKRDDNGNSEKTAKRRDESGGSGEKKSTDKNSKTKKRTETPTIIPQLTPEQLMLVNTLKETWEEKKEESDAAWQNIVTVLNAINTDNEKFGFDLDEMQFVPKDRIQ